MSIQERLDKPGPKKLLAVDGGGVRSAISIEVLAEIERLAQQAEGRDDSFVLADFFDYIGGTGVGALVAACLATGMRVAGVRDFFSSLGAAMFDRAPILQRLRYLYSAEKLEERLQELFGPDTTFGSEKIRTLLLLVAANAATNTPWPLTNNPRSKYNDPARPDSTLNLPLWQLVRGSMATPMFFPPVPVDVGGRTVFLSDGAISAYNNPSLLLLLMATLEPYKLGWRADEEHLLLVSVGAGSGLAGEWETSGDLVGANVLKSLSALPAALMKSASVEQDFLCRVLGKCLVGEPLDRELGDLVGAPGLANHKLFTYLRYDAELTGVGLVNLGLPYINAEDVQRSDSLEHIGELQMIGKAVGRGKVRPEHFVGFFNVEAGGAVRGGGGGSMDSSEATTPAPEKLAVKINQGQSYEGHDWWKWWVWVEGEDDALDKVERVIYTLDRTFPNPIREVTNRASKFRLDVAGWGVFPIVVTVVRKDGARETLVHQLVLRYPDGTPTTR